MKNGTHKFRKKCSDIVYKMPGSSKSSSPTPKKSTTRKSREPKGVLMPPHHIKRIVDGKKQMYSHFGVEYDEESETKIMKMLRFKRPEEPHSFWGNIYTLEDAVQKAYPIKSTKM